MAAPSLSKHFAPKPKSCTKPRLKQIYQEIADEIMAAIAALQPFEDVETFPR